MSNDLIDRQAVDKIIDALLENDNLQASPSVWHGLHMIKQLPSAQPTLYGYSIEHLALIATVMQKENVTPEKALEYFKDIQRMGQMIIDEQQEMIKRAVEKWTI